MIVNKAPGVLVQGDSTGDVPLLEVLKDYIKEKYNIEATVKHIERELQGQFI